jgi:hypothetical protein
MSTNMDEKVYAGRFWRMRDICGGEQNGWEKKGRDTRGL